MKKFFLFILAVFCFNLEAMEEIDSKLFAAKTRLESIEKTYHKDLSEEKTSIDNAKDYSKKNAALEKATKAIISYGAPWLDESPTDKGREGLFPLVHIYDGGDASVPFQRKIDFRGFLNYFFPNSGFDGAYNLLSGAYGNSQGGNATFGDVGGYAPGVWEFFFAVQSKTENSGLLFRPQWGFYNLWEVADKSQRVMISYSPECYMRIYYRGQGGSLNFTGAMYAGIPVSFHNEQADLNTMYVSGPTHELPQAIQASDSFVIVHKTIYRFGGPDPNNNKVVFGVLVQYSAKDLAEFQRLCREKRHLRDVLLEAPLIKDSDHLLTVLGVMP